jgi:O-antigen ligase
MNVRYIRQQDAFQLALQNPMGVGWSGSGWVHGDFTQVAADLGLIAGVIFLMWYLTTLYRAWKTYRKYPQDRVFQAILTSFILAGVVLATEGVQVLPQFAMPVWFVWGLMEAYLQQKNSIIPGL